MHKTLYIDIDEEITSIVDRVRKAEAREVIVVAPKNALLLQSIVNLKLLKKEADRRKCQLMIITQDKIGKKLVEKAGILVQNKAAQEIYLEEEPAEEAYKPKYAEEATQIKKELRAEEEELKIGSSDFFENFDSRKSAALQKEKKDLSQPADDIGEANEKKETKKSRFRMSDIVGQSATKLKKKKPGRVLPKAESDPRAEASASSRRQEKKPVFEAAVSEGLNQPNDSSSKISRISMKKAEKFFRGSRRLRKDIEITKVGRNSKKYFIAFAVAFFLLSGIAAAYFLLPKAELSLEILNQEKSAAVEITAEVQAGASSRDNAVAAAAELAAKEKTEKFESSGSKDGEGKATGKVVVYNEFSAQEQPLVATTRLRTQDGKIFRITKSIVVPGMTKIGSETKPGAIEVEVVADKTGAEYEIGPSDFKIPGFEDNSEKFEKFYAKSAKAMESGPTGERKAVTAQDIAAAKEKIAVSLKKEIVEELKKTVPSGRKIFDDAVRVEVSNIAVSEVAGAEKSDFSVTAKAQASAVSFAESAVEDILKKKLIAEGVNADAIALENSINYILIEKDFQKNFLKFEARTDAKTIAGFDPENFKKGVLGKTAEEAQIYAKTFPAVRKMDVSLWPFFARRIPMFEGRVEMKVE